MKEPTYILAIIPDQPNRVKRIFELGSDMPNSILEQSGTFRYAGWDMETRDQARIVDGKYIELKNGDRKTLHLYEDGTFIVTGAIDNNFLAWGEQRPDQGVIIHALAIIEFTTTFVYLYKRLIPTLEIVPKNLSFHIEIVNGKTNMGFLKLVPYAVNTWGFMLKNSSESLTTENPKYIGEVLTDDLLNDPDKVAFEIVKRLFLFFNIPENKIPYSVEKDSMRRVDVAKIMAIK